MPLYIDNNLTLSPVTGHVHGAQVVRSLVAGGADEVVREARQGQL